MHRTCIQTAEKALCPCTGSLASSLSPSLPLPPSLTWHCCNWPGVGTGNPGCEKPTVLCGVPNASASPSRNGPFIKAHQAIWVYSRPMWETTVWAMFGEEYDRQTASISSINQVQPAWTQQETLVTSDLLYILTQQGDLSSTAIEPVKRRIPSDLRN